MSRFIRLRSRRSTASFVAACALTAVFGVRPAAGLSTFVFENPSPVMPGETFSFLVKLSGSQALAAYQFDLLVTPDLDSFGSVTGNPLPMSNFYSSENLFTQGGMGLNSSLSSITSLMPDNPGVFVKAFDSSFLAHAIPAPGQDVLAQISMTASADARGDFLVSLGDETILAIDSQTQEDHVPTTTMTIRVLPEPGYLGILSGLAVVCLRRRRSKA